MLDPVYVSSIHTINNIKNNALDELDHQDQQEEPLLTKAILKFNPFQSITLEQKGVFYETLGLLNAFQPITCFNTISTDKGIFLDISQDKGSMEAVKHRYPKSIVYQLHYNTTVNSGERIVSAHHGVIDSTSINLHNLIKTCLHYNPRGIDVAICVVDESHIDASTACIKCLQTNGTLFYRTDNPSSDSTKKCVDLFARWFGKVILYKQVTMMCIYPECYVVCVGRRDLIGDRSLSEEDYQYQIDFLEYHRYLAIESILANISNIQSANVEEVKAEYLG